MRRRCFKDRSYDRREVVIWVGGGSCDCFLVRREDGGGELHSIEALLDGFLAEMKFLLS